nr:baseplate J/gp47 family protein [Sphingomonas sp. IC-56]
MALDNADAGSTLTLLWQLESSGAAPDWWYRSTEGWARLPVLEDGTAGLSASGILRVLVPVDRAKGQFRMQARFTGAMPKVAAILPHAFSATRRVERDTFEPIAPGTIAKLAGLTGVAAVKQPLRSTGGTARETPERVRARTIERVRHGGRVHTLWDYERLVLGNFPQVERVRAIAVGDGLTVLVEGPAPLRGAVAAWLEARASPFARIAVVAPEPVTVDVSAELISDSDMAAIEAAVQCLLNDGLALEDAAGAEAIRAQVLRVLMERPEVASVERLRVSISEGTAAWRVPVAGTIHIAAIQGATRW